VEKMWSASVLPTDGVSLRQVLRRMKKAKVVRNAPVMSLLAALIINAMGEV